MHFQLTQYDKGKEKEKEKKAMTKKSYEKYQKVIKKQKISSIWKEDAYTLTRNIMTSGQEQYSK